MENNKIIILLLCIIIALLIVGFVMFSPFMAKEDSNLAISNKKLNIGDSFVVKLTDSNGNPISNESIKIKLKDKEGQITEKDMITNSKGKVKFKMEKEGKFSVECNFEGSGHFAPSSTTGNISVKKATTKLVNEEKTSNYDSVSGLNDDGYSYDPNYGPEVDAAGTTREYAMANGWQYIPQTIDGMDAGIYVPYDSKAGCYHT